MTSGVDDKKKKAGTILNTICNTFIHYAQNPFSQRKQAIIKFIIQPVDNVL